MRMQGRARPAAVFDEVSVRPEHLPEMVHRLQAIMRGLDLSWTLDAHAGNKRQTADILGVSLKTLYNRLNTYREE